MRFSRRKREALAALDRMLEIAPEAAFDPDEPDSTQRRLSPFTDISRGIFGRGEGPIAEI
jgi:hypothetical protein